ncbi:MAG: DUF664 domain-containing protein [Deltaproteobacteria bacterium]|nr:MAG: DUF664 domain-containing protein [Deltaproteobacteria bacterium]
MNYREHLLMMARYHHWATTTLGEHVQRVSDADYRQACGLFFTSIHGTLNHLLVAERIWWGRFRQQPYVVDGLDAEVEEERKNLADAVQKQASMWETLMEELSLEELEAEFSYHNTRNEPMSAVRGPILAHVFNHGTHHRGQIGAALTSLGYDAPEIDLLYFLNPGA